MIEKSKTSKGIRKLALCSALLLGFMSASAQFSIGAKAGYALSCIDVNKQYMTNLEYIPVSGFTVGIPVAYQFNKWFGLGAELEFMQKGYRVDRSGAYQGLFNETKNSYLQLPIMANFSIGSDKVRGFANVGGYVGYWLSSHISGIGINYFGTDKNVLTQNVNVSYSENVNLDSRRDNQFEAGLTAGLGVLGKVSNVVGLQLEVRYYYALTDIQKQYMINLNPKFNNTLAVQLGCVITLK